MINQAKLRSHRTAPVYMYGHEVHRSHEQAMELDQKNGNTKWVHSEGIETSQLKQYDAFNILGYKLNALPPDGYKETWSAV